MPADSLDLLSPLAGLLVVWGIPSPGAYAARLYASALSGLQDLSGLTPPWFCGNTELKHTEGLPCCIRNFRVRILHVWLDLWQDSRIAEIRQDANDHREVLAPPQGLFEEGSRALSSPHQEHAGNGPEILVRGTQGRHKCAPGGAQPRAPPKSVIAEQLRGPRRKHGKDLNSPVLDPCREIMVDPGLGLVGDGVLEPDRQHDLLDPRVVEALTGEARENHQVHLDPD